MREPKSNFSRSFPRWCLPVRCWMRAYFANSTTERPLISATANLACITERLNTLSKLAVFTCRQRATTARAPKFEVGDNDSLPIHQLHPALLSPSIQPREVVCLPMSSNQFVFSGADPVRTGLQTPLQTS